MYEKYNLSKVYDENFLKTILPIFDFASLITAIITDTLNKNTPAKKKLVKQLELI